MNRIFHGKVMLFGEYSVMTGSHAALMPFAGTEARICFPAKAENNRSNCILTGFSSFLRHIHSTGNLPALLDFDRLDADVESGMYIQSDIPENMGLGSSGAVCAAIYWSYQKNSASGDLAMLRRIFSAMESYFHGSSSGVDPLCIFIDQPLVIKNGEYLLPALNGSYLNNRLKPFLMLSENGKSTSSMVQGFSDRMKDDRFRENFCTEYIPMVNQAVNRWVNGELDMNDLSPISDAQKSWLPEMIPADILDIWNQGITSGLYALKICGSGGGGMTLGFTEQFEETRAFLKRKFSKEIVCA